MIITCPNCATDYSVQGDVFPAEGRTVKCARCAQTWYALPSDGTGAASLAAEDDEVAAQTGDGQISVEPTDDLRWEETETLPTEAAAFAQEAEDMSASHAVQDTVDGEIVEPPMDGDENADEEQENAGDFGDTVIEARGAELVDEEESGSEEATQPQADASGVVSIEAASRARSAARRFRAPAASDADVRIRRVKSVAVGAMLALVASGLIYREDVVRTAPSMAGLYALAGFDINLRGLAFEGLMPVQEMENGIPTLKIEGGVRNVSNRDLAVPPVRLSLTADSGQEIYFWTIQTETGMIRPGETAKFRSTLSAPPRAATGIAARFVDPDKVRVGLNR